MGKDPSMSRLDCRRERNGNYGQSRAITIPQKVMAWSDSHKKRWEPIRVLSALIGNAVNAVPGHVARTVHMT
ncbi:MAG: hypothetical protein PHF64_10175 [Methanoregula sp.]|nr:hypothetical protein [Methanoregula sp.]